MDPLELVGLIASRICHDFAGPVGVLTNGAELLADEADPATRAELTVMLGSAAAKLAARVKLYRLMFGIAPASVELSVAETRSALEALFDVETRIVLEWRIADAALARPEAQLLLALALLAAESMPRGGMLRVTKDADGLLVEVEALRAALSADVLAALEGADIAGAGPRAALAHFARAMAARLGRAISAEQRPGGVVLRSQ